MKSFPRNPFKFATGRQTVFPTSFRRKPESRRFLKRFPDLPQAFAGGDEIKTWVKLSTGVKMSACPNKRSRLKANEATPSEWILEFPGHCRTAVGGAGESQGPHKGSPAEVADPELVEGFSPAAGCDPVNGYLLGLEDLQSGCEGTASLPPFFRFRPIGRIGPPDCHWK